MVQPTNTLTENQPTPKIPNALNQQTAPCVTTTNKPRPTRQNHIYNDGTIIQKKCNNNKWYEGEITAYDNKEKYYKVLYHASDTEECTHNEIKSLYKYNQTYSNLPYECPAHLATRSPSGVLMIHPKVILKSFPDPSETMIMWSFSSTAVRISVSLLKSTCLIRFCIYSGCCLINRLVLGFGLCFCSLLWLPIVNLVVRIFG